MNPNLIQETPEDEIPEFIEEIVPPPSWMLSFADVAALMLTFFVLLFSMSTLQAFPDITVSSMISTSQNPQVEEITQPTSDLGIKKRTTDKLLSPSYLSVLIKRRLSQIGVNNVATTLLPDAFLISIPHSVLFVPGEKRLSRQAQQILFDVSSILENTRNLLYIIGHIAPGDDEKADLDDGWGLSLEMATIVGKALRDSGFSGAMTFSGASDSQYPLLVEKLNVAQRGQYQRRVDLVLVSEAS